MKIGQQNTIKLDEQSLLIASEIFELINKYTHDSAVAKFFLPDEVAHACYGLAGGFSASIFNPVLEPEEVKGTPSLLFYYTIVTYGCNIYLKERSFRTNSAPYVFPIDGRFIRKVQKKTLKIISDGEIVSTPLADRIIDIIVENIKNYIKLEELRMKGHRINKIKFHDYSKLSLYWGYNFAKNLLE